MIRLAFTGNPNVGKSALINAIAGSKLKVGNWPGVTVEKKEATFTYKGEEIELVDLPGVYSLSPYSLEEKITRDFILEENPDVVINVVDSTNLERNLYLRDLLLGNIQGPLTGIPNIDKPWLKYYTKEQLMATSVNKTVYRYLYDENKKYLNDIAIIFANRKIKYFKSKYG